MIMKIKVVLFVFFLISLPSCNNKKIQQKKHTIQNRTMRQMAYEPFAIHPHIDQNNNILDQKRIVQLSLQYNAHLQQELQKLDITNADLMQAGLFSNPELFSVFRIPESKNLKTNIELDLLFSISDFWQVPLRKKVAEDELETTSLHILAVILETITEAKKAHTQYILEKKKLAEMLEAYKQAIELRNLIHERKQFGYSSDLDIHLADAMAQEWKVRIIEQEKSLNNATAFLGLIIGYVPINKDNVRFRDDVPNRDLSFNVDTLLELASQNNPFLLIAHNRIIQAEHHISFERSRVFKDVRAGFGYEKDLDGSKSGGPAISIQIPFFDFNQAQIKRAQETLYFRKKELINEEQKVRNMIEILLNTIQAHQSNMRTFDGIINSYESGLLFAKKFSKSMQLNYLVYQKTFIGFYQAKINQIDLQKELLINIFELEKTVGKNLITTTV